MVPRPTRTTRTDTPFPITTLFRSVEEAGCPTAKLTQLHLDLTPDMYPDTATGQIAYDRGATFLRTIEQAVGREKWDAYLEAYFDRHAFQPQTSEIGRASCRDRVCQYV